MTCKVYKSGIQMQPANVSLFPDRETPGPFRTHCFLPTSLRASGQCAPLWEPISLHLFARFIQTSVLLLFESCFPHSSGRCSPSTPRTEWHSRTPCSLLPGSLCSPTPTKTMGVSWLVLSPSPGHKATGPTVPKQSDDTGDHLLGPHHTFTHKHPQR